MRRVFASLAAAGMVSLPAMALGHAGGHDARGTVKEIASDRIVLSVDGKDEIFAVGGETRFERGTAIVRREDVRVGERAVVHARREGQGLHATKVKLAPSRASAGKERTR